MSNANIIKIANEKEKIVINQNIYYTYFCGTLYNREKIINILYELVDNKDFLITFDDTALITYLYHYFNQNMFKYLEGPFTFAIKDISNDLIFFARDHIGIKPLYYTDISKFNFIISDRIKKILDENIPAILDKESYLELFALGPAHNPNKTFYSGILSLLPGHYGIYKNNKIDLIKYWDIDTTIIDQSKISEEKLIKNIHDMLIDSTKAEIKTDKNICTMLSGGIDSSILTKIVNDNVNNLTTFSIDFTGNDKNFVASSYQGSRDEKYIKIMRDFLKTKNIDITIDTEELFDTLKESVICRDGPGMADIDSSMYNFCKAIKNNGFDICISGECSDEILLGYPWYYKENLKQAYKNNIFPWAYSNELRSNIINKNICNKDEIDTYVKDSISSTLKNLNINKNLDDYEKYIKQINYLTLKFFMNALIERTERIADKLELDVRIPYATPDFFTYIYNIDGYLKLGKSFEEEKAVEKYLLRKAFENELPSEVLFRKKSPFPKTYNPKYLELVENELLKILKNKNSKINKLIDTEFVLNLIKSHGENLTQNFFGQLMTYPQTLAYLIQIEYWLEKYNVQIMI